MENCRPKGNPPQTNDRARARRRRNRDTWLERRKASAAASSVSLFTLRY